MNFERYAGMVSIVGISVFVALIALLGVGGPIWKSYWVASPEQWLGFWGSIVGAFATLIAGGAALFAAYRTLGPVKDQLDELIKQNNFVLYDRLRNRTADLNAEQILIEQICAACEVFDRTLQTFIDAPKHEAEFPQLELALDRLTPLIQNFQDKRGDVWGSAEVQSRRSHFVGLSLVIGSIAAKLVMEARAAPHFSEATLGEHLQRWKLRRLALTTLGGVLFTNVLAEAERVGTQISSLERRIFNSTS